MSPPAREVWIEILFFYFFDAVHGESPPAREVWIEIGTAICDRDNVS